MSIKPPLCIKSNHRLADRLPALNLYDSLEIVIHQSGVGSMGIFLTPDDALALAEKLITLARKKIVRAPCKP